MCAEGATLARFCLSPETTNSQLPGRPKAEPALSGIVVPLLNQHNRDDSERADRQRDTAFSFPSTFLDGSMRAAVTL